MARYIDADEVIQAIRKRFNVYFEIPCSSYDLEVQKIVGAINKVIQKQPTADVAPKSEVAREIFEEIERIYDNRQTVCLSLSDFLRIKSKYIGE